MGPPPPPNGCFSTAIIRVLQEPAEIHPVAFLLLFPVGRGGCWGSAHPRRVRAARDLVLRVWKPGCSQTSHPLCPASPLGFATISQPETRLIWGSFPSSVPPATALQRGWGPGGMCSMPGGAHGKPSLGRRQTRSHKTSVSPDPELLFAKKKKKICVQGQAAALRRHRKNPKVGGLMGNVWPKAGTHRAGGALGQGRGHVLSRW